MGSVLNPQQVILDLFSHRSVVNMLIRLGRYEIKELLGGGGSKMREPQFVM